MPAIIKTKFDDFCKVCEVRTQPNTAVYLGLDKRVWHLNCNDNVSNTLEMFNSLTEAEKQKFLNKVCPPKLNSKQVEYEKVIDHLKDCKTVNTAEIEKFLNCNTSKANDMIRLLKADGFITGVELECVDRRKVYTLRWGSF